MKKLFYGILAILPLVSTGAAHADFFLDRVVNDLPEKARMERIGIGSYSFSNQANAASYRDSLFMISRVKNEAYRRYVDGRISSYRFSDTMNELETLSYSLDNYYANLSSFERTGSAFYKNLAMSDLTGARSSYARLKAITLKRQ
ncbi:MAG: hypothetical protein QG650_1067 [Patescibacteria group bacterium]|nr:hypothetical protein [Patescibacteria group bacterium]